VKAASRIDADSGQVATVIADQIAPDGSCDINVGQGVVELEVIIALDVGDMPTNVEDDALGFTDEHLSALTDCARDDRAPVDIRGVADDACSPGGAGMDHGVGYLPSIAAVWVQAQKDACRRAPSKGGGRPLDRGFLRRVEYSVQRRFVQPRVPGRHGAARTRT
jgi:hypothetical protein